MGSHIMKFKTEKFIDVQEWENLVKETYGKPYSFQQQDGCQSRGIRSLDVPADPSCCDNDTVMEKINGPEMCVRFEAWLKRDPKQPFENGEDVRFLDMWWERNFYPSINDIANDLHKKGLLEEGKYQIVIDW